MAKTAAPSSTSSKEPLPVLPQKEIRIASYLTPVNPDRPSSKRRRLDILDWLKSDPQRSWIGIRITLLDAEGNQTESVRHFAEAAQIKIPLGDIVNGSPFQWTDDQQDTSQTSLLQMRLGEETKGVMEITVNNPRGTQVVTRLGLGIRLPAWEARKLAMTVRDYIRDFETVHFRSRREALVVTIPHLGDRLEKGGTAPCA